MDLQQIKLNLLLKAFSDLGYLVSVAPQIYLSSGSTVDSSNPSNLVLTSGSPNSSQSNFTPAIASGYVDYVLFKLIIPQIGQSMGMQKVRLDFIRLQQKR